MLFELREYRSYGGGAYGWHIPEKHPVDAAFFAEIPVRQVMHSPHWFPPNHTEEKWLEQGSDHSVWSSKNRWQWNPCYIRTVNEERCLVEVPDQAALNVILAELEEKEGRANLIEFNHDPPRICYGAGGEPYD